MTREQALLSELAKAVFRLNGLFLSVGEDLARPVGLTAASWLVLSTTLRNPMTVADAARQIGVTRQSVQRTADVLVDRGLAEYRPNPAHRRAKLLAATPDGQAAIRRIAPAHATLARQLTAAHTRERLEQALATILELTDTLATLAEADEPLRAAG